MIVVDVGSYPHDRSDSIGALIDEYRPEVLIALDPLWPSSDIYRRDQTLVLVHAVAAWIATGMIELASHGADSTVMTSKNRRGEWETNPIRHVPCFNVAELAPATSPPILKLDIEGAEFPILEHLIAHAVPLAEVVVEWHDSAMDDPTLPDRKQTILARLAQAGIPTRDWWL